MKPEDVFSNQCRLNPDYYFDKCCVTTCKNYSGVVESHCLLADRKDCLNSERGMSDQEIRFFKQYPSVKQVVRNRKMAFHAVYSILILDRFVDYISQMPRIPIDPEVVKDRLVSTTLTKYPFNVPDININYSLLPRLFSEDSYSAFSVRTCQMCNEFSLASLLYLDQSQLVALAAKVKTYERS